MNKGLPRVIELGHQLLSEVVEAGQLAVDLTAGNGHDTLLLQRLVGPAGQVVAFDIQAQALQNTRQRLLDAGAAVRLWQDMPAALDCQPGCDLLACGHERIADFLPGQPQAVIANLGYLPGGDPAVITRSESTLQALRYSCNLLAAGGRLAVVAYPGHPGGREEGDQVSEFFASLCEVSFQVLQLKVANRSRAPYLLVAEKKHQGRA